MLCCSRPPSSSTSSVGLHNTRCNHLRQVIRKRRSSTAAHTGSSGNSSSNNSGTSNHCYNSISDTCSIIAVFVAVACGAHMYAFLQGKTCQGNKTAMHSECRDSESSFQSLRESLHSLQVAKPGTTSKHLCMRWHRNSPVRLIALCQISGSNAVLPVVC